MIRRWLYVLLPTAAILGSALPGLGHLFGFRLLVIICAFLALLVVRGERRTCNSVWLFRAWALALLTFGAVGLVSMQVRSDGLGALAAVGIGVVLVHSLTISADPFRELVSLRRGWILAFLVSAAVGLWELSTGQHLSNYFASHNTAGNLDYSLAASVFGNSNAFGAFLVSVCPFLAKGLVDSVSRLLVMYYGLLMVLCILLLLASGSRLCLLALVLEVAVLVVVGGRLMRRRLLATFILALTAAATFVSTIAAIAAKLPAKLARISPDYISRELAAPNGDASGHQRMSVYLDGLWMAWNTQGFGVGPGNFSTTMQTQPVPYRTLSIVDPHSAYVEVLSEYGVVALVLFLAVFVSCARNARSATRHSDASARSWAATSLAVIAGSSLSVMANSTWLSASQNWLIMGTVLLITSALPRSTVHSIATTPVHGSFGLPAEGHNSSRP